MSVSEADHISSGVPRVTLSGVRHDPAHRLPLDEGIARASACLLAQQKPDGHWVGELQGDTILESEYILLLGFLEREDDARAQKAARYVLEQQKEDGGWSNYPGGPADVSVSVKAYFALKLTGHSADAPYMVRARAVIHRLGGAAACNSFTRFYLALLGQIPYDDCPAVPPEMIFLPRWFYFNLYAMSSWTRTIVVPLSIFYAHKPVRRLPPEKGIAELFLPVNGRAIKKEKTAIFTWHNFFLMVDRLLKWLDPRRSNYREVLAGKGWLGRSWSWLTQPLTSLRAAAVHRAEKWLIEHFEDSDGVGAIFPPMIYTVISLRCLGYADDSPEMLWALRQLENLMIEERGTIRLQPCFSPVWDTALAVNALAWAHPPIAEGERRRAASSQPSAIAHPQSAIARAIEWLLAREIRRPGDWSVTRPRLEPAGWVFEYRNGFYPDMDDTAMVLMALARSTLGFACEELAPGKPGQPYLIPPVQRALRWLIGMQNSDGGWAAFDRNINREVLTKVPFADHNAMLDPSCPDITARVLEALGHYGFDVNNRWVIDGIRFIARTQDPRGCWLGRWGVNYIYGTWQVLQGLRAVNYDMQKPMVRRAVAWLEQVQQECGGWGESCRSYDDPAFAGRGTPTASQTAWALLGLLAAGEVHSPAVRRGIDYLLETQQPDGNWEENLFTGTGFPRVFYLKYHLYRLYFPLMALARYRMLTEEAKGVEQRPAPHRLGIEQRIG